MSVSNKHSYFHVETNEMSNSHCIHEAVEAESQNFSSDFSPHQPYRFFDSLDHLCKARALEWAPLLLRAALARRRAIPSAGKEKAGAEEDRTRDPGPSQRAYTVYSMPARQRHVSSPNDSASALRDALMSSRPARQNGNSGKFLQVPRRELSSLFFPLSPRAAKAWAEAGGGGRALPMRSFTLFSAPARLGAFFIRRPGALYLAHLACLV